MLTAAVAVVAAQWHVAREACRSWVLAGVLGEAGTHWRKSLKPGEADWATAHRLLLHAGAAEGRKSGSAAMSCFARCGDRAVRVEASTVASWIALEVVGQVGPEFGLDEMGEVAGAVVVGLAEVDKRTETDYYQGPEYAPPASSDAAVLARVEWFERAGSLAAMSQDGAAFLAETVSAAATAVAWTLAKARVVAKRDDVMAGFAAALGLASSP